MAGPPRPVAAARLAVKAALARRLETLADSTAHAEYAPVIVVGVSGGADSLALAATAAWVAQPMGLQVHAVIVDHGLSEDSASVTERAAETCRRLRLDAVAIRPVTVQPTGKGLEADARRARYDALHDYAHEHSSLAILLGHTMSDQAEQVLLGLARGAGARSLAGIPRERGAIIRPFLGTGRDETTGLWRSDTRAICEALDLDVWDDPMNEAPQFLRVAARTRVLPMLEEELGEHITKNLARTADLLADDAEYLETEAAALGEGMRRPTPAGSDALLALDAYALAPLHRALRTRILKSAIHDAFALAGSNASKTLLRRQILHVDSLVSAYRGQGPILLPGKIEARREDSLLVLAPGVPSRTSHS